MSAFKKTKQARAVLRDVDSALTWAPLTESQRKELTDQSNRLERQINAVYEAYRVLDNTVAITQKALQDIQGE